VGIAAATIATLVIISQPVALAAAGLTATAAARATAAAAPVHHARTIGKIVKAPPRRPERCGPVAPTLPAPATNTLAFVSESSLNQVESIDESTGALIGTPIAVGTAPLGLAYWRPPTSSSQDPEVVVPNSASNSVTVIDAVTMSVVATITLPSGSGPSDVATSPTQPYAAVVDASSGKVSIINLLNNTDAGQISLTSTANALSTPAFASSGTYAYVTDPSEHHVFVLEYTGGSAPYFTEETTYTNSSYDPTGIATDLSTSSSTSLLVTNAQSSSGSLLGFSDATGTLSAPTAVATFSSNTPAAVSVNPGATLAYVAMTGTTTVNQVTVSSGATSSIALSSGFTSVGPMALSADGSTLMAADTGSATVQELAAVAGTGTNSTTTGATVTGIAPAIATQGSWNAYVTYSGGIYVVNTGTDTITQTITDANGPVAVAPSPDGKFVYVANTSTVTVIQTSLIGTATNPVVATITGLQGAEPNTPLLVAIAVSPSGDAVIVTDQENGAAYVIDTNAADGASYRTVVKRIGLTGSGISSTLVTPQAGIAFTPDGLDAYVTVTGTSSNTYDGVTVLSIATATTTGYNYDTHEGALTEDYETMIGPTMLAVNPNGETVYVEGTSSANTPNWGLWAFPIKANGQLNDGSSTVSPIWTGLEGYGLAYSPEDDSAFVTSTASFSMTSISETYANTNYTTATPGYSGDVAVSPDGIYVAALTAYSCSEGANTLDLFDAGTGTSLAEVSFSSTPTSVAFGPQSSPQTITTSELAGGASNPAESAIAGINDEVTSGTPIDAPGATAGVDTATGAYSLSLDSMTVPDIGPSLDMTASYDSSRATKLGLLGYGWDYTYGVTATQNSHSATTNPCAIVVTQADGATVTFYPSAEGPYSTCPTSGYEASGWAQATMTFAASCNGSDSCYVMNLDATMRYFIDETTGQLVKIEDIHGNTVTILWGSHSVCSGATSTEPCQVVGADTASTHRTLTFSYPSPGTGTCPSWITSCVVVTDPLGRTVTYAMNAYSQLNFARLANSSTSATLQFQYASTSNSDLLHWWDPENYSLDDSSTTYATNVTYTSGKVTEDTGPQMTDAGTSMTATYTPTTTFAYTDFDNVTGNGTIEIADPDFNQSASMSGANLTLDTYADFQLVSSVEGYGSLADYGSYSLAPTPSESATPMRDSYNLMPVETMNALAGAQVGPGPTPTYPNAEGDEYDVGVVLNTYDAAASALMSVDESGATTTTQYNSLNEPTVSIDAIGNTAGETSSVVAAHTTTNTYDAEGDLLTTTSPATEDWTSNSKTSSYYNSNGTLCATRTADGTATYGVLSSCSTSYATTYAYDSWGDLTATTDPLGDVDEVAFDSDGNECASLTPDGYVAGSSLTSCPSTGENYETVVLTRGLYLNPAKSVSPTNAPGGTSWTYYNLNDDVIANVSSSGNPSTCSPLIPTLYCAYTRYFEYDLMGHNTSAVGQTSSAGGAGPTNNTYFDPDGAQVATVSPQGNASGSPANYETAIAVNDLGNKAAISPASNLGSGSCSITSTTLPCPDTQVSTYDPLGDPTGSVESQGGESGSAVVGTTSTYNPDVSNADSLLPTTADGFQTSSNTYDANGDETSSSVTAASTTTTGTTTTYEPNGSICWTSPTPWTGLGDPSCDDPPTAAGNQSSVDYYDADGNLLAVSEPGSNPYALGNTSGCNPLTSSICAYTAYYSFDALNRPASATLPQDMYGNYPTTTTYYDASGNQIAVTGPAGDPATCNPVTTSTCADTTYYSYDAVGRTTSITYTDGTPSVSFVYNNDGSRHTMSDGTGTTSYTYSILGTLLSVTNGTGSTVSYGYDSVGLMTCLSYPNTSGDTCTTTGAGTSSPPSGDISYFYDTSARVVAVDTWTGVDLTYAYDCTGNLYWISTGSTSGTPCTPGTPTPLSIPSASSAVTTQFSYTNGQSTHSLTTTGDGSSTLLGVSLAYSGAGQQVSSTPTTAAGTLAVDSYTYDSSGRILSGPIGSATGSTAYAYSVGGYLQSSANVFQSSSYSPMGELCWTATAASSNPCSSAPSGATTYEYDASGDRTSTVGSSATQTSLWDQASSEMTCINLSGTSCSTTAPTATTTLYTYDGNGLRATSANQGTTVAYTWDPDMTRILSDGSNDFIYPPMSTSPMMQITADGSTPAVDLLIQDANYNTRGIVQISGGNSSYNGQLVNYTDYDAFGNPITASGGSPNPGGLTAESGAYAYSTSPIGFGGGYVDASGYDYFVHRVYDSSTGQFLSVDPLVAASNVAYGYASEDPTNESDSNGLWAMYWRGEGSPGASYPIAIPEHDPATCRAVLIGWEGIGQNGTAQVVDDYWAAFFFACGHLHDYAIPGLVLSFAGQINLWSAKQAQDRGSQTNIPGDAEIRYFGGNSRFYGINVGDTYFKSATAAEAAYNLPSPDNAKYVEYVLANKGCNDWLGGSEYTNGPLYLVGGVNAGGIGVNQWLAFNADDWEYDLYIPTSQGVQPPTASNPHQAPRCYMK
jgi:RHS repeat-associated protein